MDDGAAEVPMRRTIDVRLDYWVAAPALIEVQAAVATGQDTTDEALSVSLDGVDLEVEALADDMGNRHHLVRAQSGQLVVQYGVVVHGRVAAPVTTPLDPLVLTRPSRYCEADRLAGFAASEFRGLTEAADLLPAVSSWVGDRLEYVPGSSGPTDGAVNTLLERRGVCRDYAHLTVALLRACGVPSRVVAVYAPGLWPMDFHAVVEAIVDGVWRVVDPTLLAPRSSLVRIATGRDAADTAFLTSYGGQLFPNLIEVGAVVDPYLPTDDVTELLSLG
ncbi:transglutaminase family protein [soil metagenome]